MKRVNSILLGILSMNFLATSMAAPITFNTALPVAKDEYLVRQQFIMVQSGDDPGSTDRDRRETASVTALVYGISNKLAVFGVLPYRNIELKADMGSTRIQRSNSGVGDITTFGRYIFHQNNQPGRTLRLAAFAGLKVPTGEDRESDSLGSLPPPLQTGSGSWDVFGGLVVTRQTLDYQFDGQISYRLNTEANNFEVGDILQLDASFQKRLWPRELGSGVPGFLYGVLEVNLINQGKNTLNGSNDINSGGTRVLIAPGLQYVTRRWIVEGAVQLPLTQNLNGNALELDSIVRAGVRFNF